MVSVKTNGHEIDLFENYMAESAAYVFVIILIFILRAIIEIKIFEKAFFEKIWFLKGDVQCLPHC